MNKYLIRIIKTIIFTAIGAAILAYEYKVRHELPSWDQVLTTKFWILSTIHLIPVYFIVWSCESNYETWSEGQIMLLIIIIPWFIVLGIIWAICHFLFGFDLL